MEAISFVLLSSSCMRMSSFRLAGRSVSSKMAQCKVRPNCLGSLHSGLVRRQLHSYEKQSSLGPFNAITTEEPMIPWAALQL
jgi:hypothetical protein